ncbi:MAG TPA: site-2 protease family protein [Prosthecobacter sp.]|nr:site-2 protease family protein [Prosthecobacter sp.]HRK13881.1 site-2 protease family protein [Prosthecobacter sp.]
MLRFRLFGFPILVHWFFWVNMALLGGAIGADTPEAMQRLLMWMAAGFVSIVVHELGHAFAMRHYGDRHVNILLYAFGGLAQGSRGLTRRQDFFVSGAGPFAQIAAGVVMWWVYDLLGPGPGLPGYFMRAFMMVSFFWAVLNLFPIIPLDGGHICLAVLGPRRVRLALVISLVCAVAGGLWFLSARSIFAALFFGMFAFNNWKELQGRPQTPWMMGRN